MPRALIVLTSADKLPGGEQTGFYLPEAAHPYYVFTRDAGWDVTFASLKGGAAPIDPTSKQTAYQKDDESTSFLDDAAVQQQLSHTPDVHTLRLRDFDAVFIAGGHGPMVDMAADPRLGGLLTEYISHGGAVGAVCHGVAALLHVTDAKGAPLVRGREVTSFTDAEERQAGMEAAVPFLLEARLRQLGARFTCAGPFSQHVCVADDVRLVTGQNPNSARPAAEALVALVGGRPTGAVAHDSLVGEEVAHKLPPLHQDAHGPFVPPPGAGGGERKHPLEPWALDK